MFTGESQSRRDIGLLGRYNLMEGTCVRGGEGLELLMEVKAGEQEPGGWWDSQESRNSCDSAASLDAQSFPRQPDSRPVAILNYSSAGVCNQASDLQIR